MRGFKRLLIFIYLILALLLAGGVRAQEPQDQAVLVRAYAYAYSFKYDLKPEYALAVANVESRKSNLEFRVGAIGRRYYGPFGIHKDYLKRGWPIDTLPGNVEAGCRALKGIQTLPTLKRRLRTYNAQFNEGYWEAICQAVKRYENN